MFIDGSETGPNQPANIIDTGDTTDEEYFETFQYLKKHVPGIDTVVLSAHCHNDLGMAVANSLAAVRAGARQVDGRIASVYAIDRGSSA